MLPTPRPAEGRHIWPPFLSSASSKGGQENLCRSQHFAGSQQQQTSINNSTTTGCHQQLHNANISNSTITFHQQLNNRLPSTTQPLTSIRNSTTEFHQKLKHKLPSSTQQQEQQQQTFISDSTTRTNLHQQLNNKTSISELTADFHLPDSHVKVFRLVTTAMELPHPPLMR